MVNTLNGIAEFNVIGVFLWALLSISCLMLTLQSELVKCSNNEKRYDFFLNWLLIIFFSWLLRLCRWINKKKLSKNANQIEVVRISVLLSWSLIMLFILCEFGELMAQRFERFDETIEQCDWYLYPHDIQRLFVIVLSNTQRSTYLRGFGNVPCARDSFKRVFHIDALLTKC